MTQSIEQRITKAAKKAGIRDEAIEDFLFRKTEFALDVTDRLVHVPTSQSAKRLFRKALESRPELRGPNYSANNTDPANPFTLPPGADGDAKRAAFILSQGTRKADELAKAAGRRIDGRPRRQKA